MTSVCFQDQAQCPAHRDQQIVMDWTLLAQGGEAEGLHSQAAGLLGCRAAGHPLTLLLHLCLTWTLATWQDRVQHPTCHYRMSKTVCYAMDIGPLPAFPHHPCSAWVRCSPASLVVSPRYPSPHNCPHNSSLALSILWMRFGHCRGPLTQALLCMGFT